MLGLAGIAELLQLLGFYPQLIVSGLPEVEAVLQELDALLGREHVGRGLVLRNPGVAMVRQ